MDLPYELLALIQEHAVSSLSPRARTRTLSALATVSRNWYSPAHSLLFASPALPGRCVWLLGRTFRHEPGLVQSLSSITVCALGSPTLLVALLQAGCPHLRKVVIRTSKTNSAIRAHWDPLLRVLERMGLEEFDWRGPDWMASPAPGVGVTGAFGWRGLEVLSLADEHFSITHPWLCPIALNSPAPSSTHPPSLARLTINHCDLPLAFFDRLSPYLASLTSLTLITINGLSSTDFNRALIVLGPHLKSLTLQGDSLPANAPSRRLVLSTKSFALLPVLESLSLCGKSAPLDLFEILPATVTSLSLDVGEQLEPEWLWAGLKNELRSEGLKTVAVKLRGFGKEWQEENLREWMEWKARIEDGGRQREKVVEVSFVDRRQ